nr:retrovirus-related Pol polyprotein from transposon TNT 1-94 [Tanacetum cinerariifolium]
FFTTQTKLRPTKDFEAKYNKVKAKLALLSSSSSASKGSMVKNKGLITKAYEWDKEELSSDDNKMVKVKVLMALAEENDVVSKEGTINDEWVKISMRNVHTLLKMEDNDDRKVYLDYLSIDLNYVKEQRRLKDLVFVKSSSDDTKVTIPGVERPWLSEAKGFILPNHDTSRILPSESQRNTTASLVLIMIQQMNLWSKSTFNAEALKDIIINELSSAPAKGNKSSSASKVQSAPADKPCSSCEKGKHHRASFKTKQTSSIKKCLQLLHMDLFRPVTPRSINHEKYTIVIVDEYSRYTWVYFLKKKSQAPETIMSFIKRVENQNDIKVKQLRTDNGTEFRNSTLVNFCNEKGISQNFSSPYTPEQNGVAERKNKTLIEAARIMFLGFVLSKQYWNEAVTTACYTQNRSTIVKRHLKTPYEFFHKIILNISFLHVFVCPVYIHNHKDHLGKFDEKIDDGYLLGYLLVSKAFRVFNTRIQQTKETYHIAFDESPKAINFSKPLVDNINEVVFFTLLKYIILNYKYRLNLYNSPLTKVKG